jgi:hypothetical protein
MNFEPYTGVYRLLTEGMFQYEGLSNRTLTYDFRGWILGKEFLPRSLNILDTCQHWGILYKRHREKMDHKAELKFLKVCGKCLTCCHRANNLHNNEWQQTCHNNYRFDHCSSLSTVGINNKNNCIFEMKS